MKQQILPFNVKRIMLAKEVILRSIGLEVIRLPQLVLVLLLIKAIYALLARRVMEKVMMVENV